TSSVVVATSPWQAPMTATLPCVQRTTPALPGASVVRVAGTSGSRRNAAAAAGLRAAVIDPAPATPLVMSNGHLGKKERTGAVICATLRTKNYVDMSMV